MCKLRKISAKLKALFYYSFKMFHFGSHSLILSPLKIEGMENMGIGDGVYIGEHTWLAAMPLTTGKAQLLIGNGCAIGHRNHIYATKRIVLEDNVLTADSVYISDNSHTYSDVHTPILKQPIEQLKEVRIGEGSWLGEHVCVIGASVGKHCVIGANAVVTHDIPDFSVAVGAPAKVIKQYNFNTRQWEQIK